jgi:thiamine biosynthesis protein ThiS
MVENMIKVNGKELKWYQGITFSEVYKTVGYTIRNPRVLIRVNGKPLRKNERAHYIISDGDEIEIINTLCGG